MKKLQLFFTAIVLGMTPAAQAQTAVQQLFGMNLPEIELPEASVQKVLPVGEDIASGIRSRALPQPGQNILGKDNFTSKVTAMQQYREVLGSLRQMGVKIIESPEGGVYSYMEPNYDGMGAYTKYGYIIEYEGAQLVMDSFSPPKVAMSQWQIDAAVSALKRYKAHIRYTNSNNISYIRYKSKPTLLSTYDIAQSQREAERVRTNVENNLRSRGFETIFNSIYENKYYDQNWMGWKSDYHVNVIYLSIVD